MKTIWVVLALVIAVAACAEGPADRGGQDRVRIAFVGDTHGYNIITNPALDDRDLLEGVEEVLDGVDVLVLNHEGTLIEANDVAKHCRTFASQSTFAAPPSFARRLPSEPRAVASLANNHALDCGPQGLAQTRAALAEAGILAVGAGSRLDEACQPARLTVNGVPMAFLAYLLADFAMIPADIVASAEGPGVATMDRCNAETVIRALAPQAVVIVSLHAHVGSSWTHATTPEHLTAVRSLLCWGADVVASHGPHFPQGVLAQGDGLAFLSLGNFMFRPDYDMPSAAHKSLLALLEVSEGVSEARLYPLEVTAEGLPVLAAEPASQEILELVTQLSTQHGTSIQMRDGFGLLSMDGVRRPVPCPAE